MQNNYLMVTNDLTHTSVGFFGNPVTHWCNPALAGPHNLMRHRKVGTIRSTRLVED